VTKEYPDLMYLKFFCLYIFLHERQFRKNQYPISCNNNTLVTPSVVEVVSKGAQSKFRSYKVVPKRAQSKFRSSKVVPKEMQS
jgi:hypothetical protein